MTRPSETQVAEWPGAVLPQAAVRLGRRGGVRLRRRWRRLVRGGRRARAVALAHPRLVASWAEITAGLLLGEAATLALEARLGHAREAQRAAPGAAAFLALTQLDTLLRLGMHRPAPEEPVFEDLGLYTTLTLARLAQSGVLWGHLLGGTPAPPRLTLALLIGASASDIADGRLARRLERVSPLGGYLDAVADGSFGLALTLTLGLRRLLPRWLLALLLARWGLPALYVVAGALGWRRPVPMHSTIVGKAAAVAQAVALGAALLPDDHAGRTRRVRGAIHTATAALLVAAPLAQLWKVLRKR
jgi:phosphatidylglycerophosphate synthase